MRSRVRTDDGQGLRTVWHSALRRWVSMGTLRIGGNLHFGYEPRLRNVWNGGLHDVMQVEWVLWRRGVRAGLNPAFDLRPVLAPGLSDELQLGWVQSATVQRVRVSDGRQHPCLLRLSLRKTVVYGYVSMEYRMHVVLHWLRRMPVAGFVGSSALGLERHRTCGRVTAPANRSPPAQSPPQLA